jgi:hypothetical protein
MLPDPGGGWGDEFWAVRPMSSGGISTPTTNNACVFHPDLLSSGHQTEMG